MKEHIEILRKFLDDPYEVLGDDKDKKKLVAAINKSIKVLRATDSRNKAKRMEV